MVGDGRYIPYALVVNSVAYTGCDEMHWGILL